MDLIGKLRERASRVFERGVPELEKAAADLQARVTTAEADLAAASEAHAKALLAEVVASDGERAAAERAATAAGARVQEMTVKRDSLLVARKQSLRELADIADMKAARDRQGQIDAYHKIVDRMPAHARRLDKAMDELAAAQLEMLQDYFAIRQGRYQLLPGAVGSMFDGSGGPWCFDGGVMGRLRHRICALDLAQVIGVQCPIVADARPIYDMQAEFLHLLRIEE